LKIKSRQMFILLILVLGLTLVACEGKNDDDANVVLPTLVVFSTRQPEATIAESIPQATIEEPTSTLILNISPTEHFDITAESTSAVDEGPSSTLTAIIAEIPVQPTPELPEVGLTAEAELATQQDGSITNFGLLEGETVVSLIGVISLLENETDVNGQPIVVISDPEGNAVRVEIPSPLAGELIGQTVQITGMVTLSDIESVYLQITPNTVISGSDIVQPELIISGTESELEEEVTPELFVDGPVIRLSGYDRTNPPTALQTYDMLIEVLGDEVSNLEWVSLMGRRLSGWTFTFGHPDDDLYSVYIVDPNGIVQTYNQQQAPINAPNYLPINRLQIVVDSDQVSQAVAEAGGPPVTASIMMTLEATNTGIIAWTVLDFNIDSINATIDMQ
jgi:hypothetical protein